ncbi:MAG: hypothetical protein ACPL7K_00815 [Armatimonadota bacterium]
MMDIVSLNTATNPDGTFTVRWKWRQQQARQPSKGGVVRVSFPNNGWTQDRPILAELAAVHRLLEVEKVHGHGRLGNNIRIQTTFGAIRKTLLKGALKENGRGDTDKTHVALFSKFLATKYFEAEIEVLRPEKWRDEEPKLRLDFDLVVTGVPMVTVNSIIGPLVVSRHALNRVVERCICRSDLQAHGKTKNDPKDLPDRKWTSAWRHLEKVLPNAVRGHVVESEHRRVLRKYGKSPTYLWHQDSGLVYVVAHESYGMELVTALDDEYWIAKNIPTQRGQRLIYRVAT